MTFSRRILIPGLLISLPVVFAAASIALAQSPGAPQLPQESVVVDFATPTPSPTPTPVEPLPAPSAAPVAPPATGDDDRS
ncbi:MAG TPA: hypothetical protein VN035_13130, partial [Microbacterium sp.]|nr:hypothetical protein [Microbacterium sp.]